VGIHSLWHADSAPFSLGNQNSALRLTLGYLKIDHPPLVVLHSERNPTKSDCLDPRLNFETKSRDLVLVTEGDLQRFALLGQVLLKANADLSLAGVLKDDIEVAKVHNEEVV